MTKATFDILRGDVIEQLKKLDDDSVDAVVTDPPYNVKMSGQQNVTGFLNQVVLSFPLVLHEHIIGWHVALKRLGL
jgi:DNA modification methylase